MSSSPHNAVLCFDFDGTFVDQPPDPEALAALLGIIEDLRTRGAAWVINTGRSLFHTLDGLTRSHIKTMPDFIIAREGEIYALNSTRRWVPFGDWNDRMSKKQAQFYKSHARFFKQVKGFVASNTWAQYLSEPQEPAGIVATTDEEMDTICEWLETTRHEHPELDYQRNSIYLRFTHQDYNKGTALRELCTMLAVPTESVLVAGDNFNDFSMLTREIADVLVCPANAIPAVRELVEAQGGIVAPRPATWGCVDALMEVFY